MANIEYFSNNKTKKTITATLPEKIFIRTDFAKPPAITWASLDMEHYANDPADQYNYDEMLCEENLLVAYMLCYQYNLIEHTEENDATYDDVVTYNLPITTVSQDGNITFEVQFSQPPAKVIPDDYVPPNIVEIVPPSQAAASVSTESDTAEPSV